MAGTLEQKPIEQTFCDWQDVAQKIAISGTWYLLKSVGSKSQTGQDTYEHNGNFALRHVAGRVQ